MSRVIWIANLKKSIIKKTDFQLFNMHNFAGMSLNT